MISTRTEVIRHLDTMTIFRPVALALITTLTVSAEAPTLPGVGAAIPM